MPTLLGQSGWPPAPLPWGWPALPPWGLPVLTSGVSWCWELCQGGTLHRVDWQQVWVIWVPSTVLTMGWQVSVHHIE
jgi:hypothetical protein